MTTASHQTTNQAQERARLLNAIVRLQAEIAQVQLETAQTWAQVHADNRHLFTLTFMGGEVALLEVRGAEDQEKARLLAHNAITRCSYTVTDGDQTNGNAHCFYYWYSIEAQERSPRRVLGQEVE